MRLMSLTYEQKIKFRKGKMPSSDLKDLLPLKKPKNIKNFSPSNSKDKRSSPWLNRLDQSSKEKHLEKPQLFSLNKVEQNSTASKDENDFDRWYSPNQSQLSKSLSNDDEFMGPTPSSENVIDQEQKQSSGPGILTLLSYTYGSAFDTYREYQQYQQEHNKDPVTQKIAANTTSAQMVKPIGEQINKTAVANLRQEAATFEQSNDQAPSNPKARVKHSVAAHTATKTPRQKTQVFGKKQMSSIEKNEKSIETKEEDAKKMLRRQSTRTIEIKAKRLAKAKTHCYFLRDINERTKNIKNMFIDKNDSVQLKAAVEKKLTTAVDENVFTNDFSVNQSSAHSTTLIDTPESETVESQMDCEDHSNRDGNKEIVPRANVAKIVQSTDTVMESSNEVLKMELAKKDAIIHRLQCRVKELESIDQQKTTEDLQSTLIETSEEKNLEASKNDFETVEGANCNCSLIRGAGDHFLTNNNEYSSKKAGDGDESDDDVLIIEEYVKPQTYLERLAVWNASRPSVIMNNSSVIVNNLSVIMNSYSSHRSTHRAES